MDTKELPSSSSVKKFRTSFFRSSTAYIFLLIDDKTAVDSPSHHQDNAEKYDEADV